MPYTGPSEITPKGLIEALEDIFRPNDIVYHKPQKFLLFSVEKYQEFIDAGYPAELFDVVSPFTEDTDTELTPNTNQPIMEKSEVEKTVHQILVDKLGVDASEVVNQSHVGNDLGADSLDCVEIIMTLEREFNIGISDDEIENANPSGDLKDLTVQQLVDIVHSKV